MMTMTNEDGGGQTHTLGAIRAAEIITGGKYGDSKKFLTTYGHKTVEGVADIIDREIGAAELVGQYEKDTRNCGDIGYFDAPRVLLPIEGKTPHYCLATVWWRGRVYEYHEAYGLLDYGRMCDRHVEYAMQNYEDAHQDRWPDGLAECVRNCIR